MRRRMPLKMIFIGLVVLLFKGLYAQQKDSLISAPSLETASAGSVKGKVKDSAYNFMLTSATVAVYTNADSSLLHFAIPNNFGEFAVDQLPTGIPLHLVITHTGYKPFFKKFTLSQAASQKDFGLLYMYQHTDKEGNMLEEVVVKAVPPVRMNGDTLEFNADAFKMDANATGEDWMRILPGLTIWGDGEITFNGKKIQSLLVDGKPFMGGETTVATQNLPKEALEKLQIYQQRDEKNPLDSTMYANLKLKDDKKMGYFGKIGGGYGFTPPGLLRQAQDNMRTVMVSLPNQGKAGGRRRYTADGMISGFNKKTQLNVVGAINNINKLASGIDVLMNNSSYKGEGANTDYQSNFTMRGLNRPIAAGAKFQYDFIPDPAYRKRSRLNADYFINDNQTVINNTSLSNNYLTGDTVLSRNAVSRQRNYATDQRLYSAYELSTERMNLSFNSALTSNYDNNNNESVSEQQKTGIGIIGNSTANSSGQNRKNSINMGINYNNREVWGRQREQRIPSEFSLGYQFTASAEKGSSRNFTKYTSPVNPASNKEFDRLYQQRDGSNSSHRITASYPGLRRLIFNRRSFGGIDIGVSGSFDLKNTTDVDKVLDKDSVTQNYVLNSYLTNDRESQTQNFIPTLSFSKTFYKGLTNRYNKWVSLKADLKKQFFSMQHSATQIVQNFAYSYSNFIPQASAEYYNHQYGSYEMRYNLDYTTSVNYPGLNNIAPLVDSTNLWYIPKGNPLIQPQYKKELEFKYSFNTRTPKNPLRFNIGAAIGAIDNNITDSTLFDEEGVRTVYTVNASGNRYFNGNAGIKKSIEMKKQRTLEVEGKYDYYTGKDPHYINSALVVSNGINHNMRFNLSYRYKDQLFLKGEESVGWYNSRQQGLADGDNSFKNANQFTRFSGSLQLPKNLVWATNITYNKNKAGNSAAINYTIWNASLTYRFLKGNQGEAKFSALDLLRQNKGIVNTIKGNMQTLSSTNVLQQYFMITLAYYPRKFGSSKSRK
ncbi:hypothetical protein ABDK00_009965 [Niabella insulamsoli]|uniref:hypothetical protein n=1 Tax=Niabella insulamsoli TaxID=3144874 RepID=UPI0031FBFF4F